MVYGLETHRNVFLIEKTLVASVVFSDLSDVRHEFIKDCWIKAQIVWKKKRKRMTGKK